MAFEKKDYPVIFIGLGGSGKDAVLAIKHKFEKHLVIEPTTGKPRRTAYMVIDADNEKTAELGHDYKNITVPGIENLLIPNSPARTAIENEWYNPNIPAAAITYGAGCIRQVGRMQLFRHFTAIKNHFLSLVDKTAKAAGGFGHNKIDVVICAGLTGGTGSGTLLDMGYLVSEWVKSALPNFVTKIYGFFTMPDLYMRGDALDERKKANAYAALKELDYWQNVVTPETRMNHVQRYPDGSEINWKENANNSFRRPYDLVFLLSGKFENGAPIAGNAYREICNKIAETMLCSYADETAAEGGSFSFDSFMSNVSAALLLLGESATEPVNYSFATLGFGSTNVMEQHIQQYETDITLGEVLTAQLFDQNGQAVEGNHMVYRNNTERTPELTVLQPTNAKPFLAQPEQSDNFVKAVFAPDEASFVYADLVTKEEKDFSTAHAYKPPKKTYVTLSSLSETEIMRDIERYIGQEGDQGWKNGAFTRAENLKNHQWNNFVGAVKKAIAAPAIGPVALADYLERFFVPTMEELVECWKEKSGSEKNNAEVIIANAIKHIDATMNPGGLPGILKGAVTLLGLGKDAQEKLEKETQKEWGKAAGAMRNSVYASARYSSMRAFVQQAKDYLNNLKMLNNTLLSIQEEAGNKMAHAQIAIDENALISAQQIKEYFDTVAGRAHAVAQAKTQILARLATLSFELPVPTAYADHLAMEEYKAALYGKIDEFITSVHHNMNMGTLDWIVDSAVPEDADVQSKINHVTNSFAPKLDGMAVPMLPKTPDAPVIPAAQYRYISVPKDAPTLLAGFQAYTPVGAVSANQVEVKASEATDRIVWLKVNAGIALKDIVSMDTLYESYEKIQSTHGAAGGVHINDTNWVRHFEADVLLAPEQAGTLLPDAFFHELTHPALLSDRARKNWEYAKEMFQNAERHGLVIYDELNKTFRVRSLKERTNVQNFRDITVDQALKNQPYPAALDEIERIKKKHFGYVPDPDTQQPALNYGQYLDTVLAARHIVAPAAGASHTQVLAYEEQVKAVRSELCAYLFMRRPNYLFDYAKFGECMRYLNEREAAIRSEMVRTESISVLRLFLSGKISCNRGTFVLSTPAGAINLFTVAPGEVEDAFGLAAITPAVYQSILQNYPLAVFYSLYQTKMEAVKVGANAVNYTVWQQSLAPYGGLLADMEVAHRNEFDEYAAAFRAEYEVIEGFANPNFSAINTDANFQTVLEKNAIIGVYQRIKEILEDDSFRL